MENVAQLQKRIKELEEENKSLQRTIGVLKDKKLVGKLSEAYEEHKKGKGYSQEDVFGHLK